MVLVGHYPQNTISHFIIFNETQITLHFFQGRISATQEIRANLFFAISKTGMCVSTLLVFFNVLLFWFPADQGLKKVNFIRCFSVLILLCQRVTYNKTICERKPVRLLYLTLI